MKKLEFRTLTADEVECRIGSLNKAQTGCSLLLYKDARVDQRLLDEVVGVFNWKNHYEVIKNALYCTIEIWDEDKNEWISKQNCGTESSSEATKGEASDAFKRACFNLGIGRELYSAPFIWVNFGNGIDRYTSFKVTKLEYDENRKPTVVEIAVEKTGQVVYSYNNGKKVSVQPQEEPIPQEVIDEINNCQTTASLMNVYNAQSKYKTNSEFLRLLGEKKQQLTNK